MRHSAFKKLTALLICAAALLPLCGCAETYEPPEEQEELPGEEPEPEVFEEGYTKADTIFSLNYSLEESLNPFFTTDLYNDQLMTAVYESLFVLDTDLKPRPVLCESYSTTDGLVYTIEIIDDVYFHNGIKLTAKDVAYSINAARSCSKYSSRLSCVESADYVDDDTLKITLIYANYSLPALLDTPIVMSGMAEAQRPDGTGLYYINGARLRAYDKHRSYTEDTLDTIYLKDFSSEELAEAFSGRSVDIVEYDPTGTFRLNIHMVHETRTYNTTHLLYLGFNAGSGATLDAPLRQALARLVNSETICNDIYGGNVVPAPLILSPLVDVYSAEWENGTGYSRTAYSTIASSAGYSDSDRDGYIDDPWLRNVYLKFIVNSENSRKVAAAKRIVTDMQNMGVMVELSVLSWADYIEALESGNFSMYLGEVKLKADFDLTALFSGALNYGGIDDPLYDTLIKAFLGAGSGEARFDAAKALCDHVREQAAIVPIAYKEYSVLTHTGVISGAMPSQSGIYNDIAAWKFTQ